ncbi:hypothetical protein KJ840_01655 [Patescibacteria group bacterium]|nr:hypothetical protein [Patescibacteria group bacterium]
MSIKKTLIIISLLYIAYVLVMPFAVPNCGMNGFYVGFPKQMNECHNETGLAHIEKMANFLLSGNVVSVFLWTALIFSVVIAVFSYKIKLIILPNFKNLISKKVIGRLKPFDKLLLAYKKGIIQNLTFCRI